ncbi:hypothetical protein V9T40_010904 [Parthenolecanium corni]|uniref:BTB domain-containing protein n=1 Tax=Parthenolecanium corni TaxID=536013 RepID=A0AAN9T4G3_9HEMI
MAANQQFCLRWNNHQRTLISVFDSLLESGTLVDCTLAAEGQYLKAHKVVLSACSPYLGVLLSSHHEKHPILILKDIKFQELKAMLDYMYRGEVNISQEQLGTFLKAAESLQIKGLTESAGLNPETKDFEERLVKRYDRKCPSATTPLPNHNAARVRSPPSANALSSAAAAAVISEHAWNQKYAATAGFRACSSPPRIRDGSLSPTARKRRKQQHPISSSSSGSSCVEEAPLLPISPLITTALNASIPHATTATTTTTTTSSTHHSTGSSRADGVVVENHQDAAAASSVDPLGDAAAVNSVTSSNSNNNTSSNSSSNSICSNGSSANPLSMTMNSIKAEHTDKCNDNETRSTDSGNSSTTTTSSAKVNDLPIVPKSEPKFDDRHSDGEAAYEDSVEEMTLEDEEEEIDETDLSRPGPSHSEDSQNFGESRFYINYRLGWCLPSLDKLDES